MNVGGLTAGLLLGALTLSLTPSCSKPETPETPAPPAKTKRTFKRTLKVLDVSTPPAPATAPYTECLFVARVEVLTPERFAGERANLALWAFRDRKLLDSALVRPGDELVCRLVDYESVDALAPVQLVDDVGDLDRPTYFAETMRNVADTTEREAVTVSRDEPELDPDAQFAMLKHMHDRMAARGIHLLVVPFPFREEVSDEHAFENSEHERFITLRRDLITRLNAAGVDALDLADKLRQSGASPLYYTSEDHHPADAGIQVAASAIAEHLVAGDQLARGERNGWSKRSIAFRKLPGFGGTQILDESGEPLSPDPASAILVAGDSYARYPESTPHGSITGANLASHLAAELRTRVRQFSVSSGGAVMPRTLARRPELLEGVRVFVFPFSAYYPWTSGERHWEPAEF